MAEKEDGGKGVSVEKDALVKVKEGSLEDGGKIVDPALQPASDKIEFKQKLSLLNCVTDIVGSITCSGIFVSPKGVLAGTGSVGLSLVVWVLSGIYSMIGAYCYAEPGTAIVLSGADYAYLFKAFGPFLAFSRLWVEWMIVWPCSQAIVALTFAYYVIEPLFPDCHQPHTRPVRLLAVCILSPFVAMFKSPLIPFGKMQLIFFLVISQRLLLTGSMETEYSSSNEATLYCTFPENSTRTDFAVYFYYEDGKTELLVDCGWVVDKLECIKQQGFKCRLPVPVTAEIEVPQRFVTRPGKIGYTLNGGDPSNVNLCHFVENQTEGREESQNKMQQSNIKENNYDHEASRDFPVWVIGLVIGALLAVGVIVMVIVLYKKMCRRNTQTRTQEESDVESPSLVSTENSSRDDNSS